MVKELALLAFQPAEFTKTCFCFNDGKNLESKIFSVVNNIQSVILNHTFIVLLTFMLMKQPDFGSTL